MFQSGLFGCKKWGSMWVSPGRGGLRGGYRRGPGSVPLLCSLSLQARCSGLQSHSFSVQTPWHSCIPDFAPWGWPSGSLTPTWSHSSPSLSSSSGGGIQSAWLLWETELKTEASVALGSVASGSRGEDRGGRQEKGR